MLNSDIIIYTDGACSGNPGPGGWGAVIIDGASGKILEKLSDGEPWTTNNRMELQAVINALKKISDGANVTLYSDSQYIVNMFKQGWITKWRDACWTRGGDELKNKDLVIELYNLSQKLNIEWNWVRGHNGDTYNEECDRLAVAQRDHYASYTVPEEDTTDDDMDDLAEFAFEPELDEDDSENAVEENRRLREENDILRNSVFELLCVMHRTMFNDEQPCGKLPYCEYCAGPDEKNSCAGAYLEAQRKSSEVRV